MQQKPVEPRITEIYVTHSGNINDFSSRELKRQTMFNYVIHNHTIDKERDGYATQNPFTDNVLRICLVGNTHKKPLTLKQEQALISIAAGAMNKYGLTDSNIIFNLGMHARHASLLERIVSFRER